MAKVDQWLLNTEQGQTWRLNTVKEGWPITPGENNDVGGCSSCEANYSNVSHNLGN